MLFLYIFIIGVDAGANQIASSVVKYDDSQRVKSYLVRPEDPAYRLAKIGDTEHATWWKTWPEMPIPDGVETIFTRYDPCDCSDRGNSLLWDWMVEAEMMWQGHPPKAATKDVMFHGWGGNNPVGGFNTKYTTACPVMEEKRDTCPPPYFWKWVFAEPAYPANNFMKKTYDLKLTDENLNKGLVRTLNIDYQTFKYKMGLYKDRDINQIPDTSLEMCYCCNTVERQQLCVNDEEVYHCHPRFCGSVGVVTNGEEHMVVYKMFAGYEHPHKWSLTCWDTSRANPQVCHYSIDPIPSWLSCGADSACISVNDLDTHCQLKLEVYEPGPKNDPASGEMKTIRKGWWEQPTDWGQWTGAGWNALFTSWELNGGYKTGTSWPLYCCDTMTNNGNPQSHNKLVYEPWNTEWTWVR